MQAKKSKENLYFRKREREKGLKFWYHTHKVKNRNAEEKNQDRNKTGMG